MVTTVGYLEAWSLWWNGVDLKPMKLYGVPMIWIGRISKVVSFAASLIVILDILGPERVRRFSLQRRPEHPDCPKCRKDQEDSAAASLLYTFLAGGVLTLAVLKFEVMPWYYVCIIVIMLLISVPLALFFFVDGIVPVVSRALDSERDQRIVRWTSLAAVVIGFSFDLLTS